HVLFPFCLCCHVLVVFVLSGHVFPVFVLRLRPHLPSATSWFLPSPVPNLHPVCFPDCFLLCLLNSPCLVHLCLVVYFPLCYLISVCLVFLVGSSVFVRSDILSFFAL